MKRTFIGSSAWITGASSGLGAEFARQLAPEAACLVLTARREERLRELAEELRRKRPKLQIVVAPADLTCAEAVEGVLDLLTRERIEVDTLVNNAGSGDSGLFYRGDWDRLRSMLDLNVGAFTRLLWWLLPRMIRRGKGCIINVGSIAGLRPVPFYSAYAATKAYVHSLSHGLEWELAGTGVTLTQVCPASVATEFFERAARSPEDLKKIAGPSFMWTSPEEVVRCSLDAARRGKPQVTPGFVPGLCAAIFSYVPIPLLRMAYRAVLSGKRKPGGELAEERMWMEKQADGRPL
ncbi:17beta-estradiol 17-dehydrogenase / very-long-chain 3-oxoacyl-CoA reductase [Methylacidimicrobium cyclopophantes]|uniref:17beta-estradiol 17-dehydrogenase / very-long-chain 3-oxoacyl-CoA reductase n=1 Tax=Methylacidimicrobium cyclopophantes TaxID=1041766 RepID=A0A5E6MEB2_9BACT|nr:SDR family NAD(P)-dependent oxidoreductase [Methylacidimicrobium cyclopophantes]VVM06163.1 17beta-estradiol 17-dehydrogenase / very-long-chain 3-oxoacyl-CoA reductase [Methylacidimicrobium cyclopophantes]